VIVLGIETSTARSSVMVLVDGTPVAGEHHEDARGHGAFLAPAVRRCLDAVGGAGALGAIGVGTGPGLYTGLRVGMATAAALASARSVPVVGIGGLDVLARMAAPLVAREAWSRDGAVVTTLDARRGQVFWAVHATNAGTGASAGTGAGAGAGTNDGTGERGPRVGTRAQLDEAIAALHEHGPVLVVGEVASGTVLRPDAATLAELTVERLAAEEDGRGPERFTPAALTAVYLRDADVRIGWDERGGVRGGVPAGGPA
jgi:tRNA threonylcarbamoyladenosine biosynthesis protein TsaB